MCHQREKCTLFNHIIKSGWGITMINVYDLMSKQDGRACDRTGISDFSAIAVDGCACPYRHYNALVIIYNQNQKLDGQLMWGTQCVYH